MKESLLKTLSYLMSGIDPLTGELFDKKILSIDGDLSKFIKLLALSTQEDIQLIKKPAAESPTCRNVDRLWKELRKWRLEKAHEIQLPAYCVFTDEELWSIALSNIQTKEELLLKGIRKKRYDIYGDEIFELLKVFCDDTISARTHQPDDDLRLDCKTNVCDSSIIPLESPCLFSCKKCMLYRREDCVGDVQICDFFEQSPDISDEEIKSWPEYGDATNLRLHYWRSK